LKDSSPHGPQLVLAEPGNERIYFKGGKGDLQWTSRDKAEVEAENSILELIDECCQLRFILRNLKRLRLSLSVIAQFMFKMGLIA
jgi:hypothetical protein